jgi:hypothetical protein
MECYTSWNLFEGMSGCLISLEEIIHLKLFSDLLPELVSIIGRTPMAFQYSQATSKSQAAF